MQAYLTRFISLVFTFPLGFLAMLTVATVDLIWIQYSNLELPLLWLSFVNILYFAYFKIIFQGLLLGQIITSPKIISFLKKIFWAAEFILVFTGLGISLCLLSYLFSTFGYPLIDQELMALDRAIGFDWSDMFAWVQTEHVKIILAFAYKSLPQQVIFLIILFVFLGKIDRIRELFWVFFSSLFLTIVIFGFFPVLGPAHELGLIEPFATFQPLFEDAYADLTAIRASGNSPLAIDDLTGIIGFPSFHTASAIALIYASRHCGILTYVMVLLNLTMLLATPVFGNHYMMDMLAGALIVLNIIIIMRWRHQKTHKGFVAKIGEIRAT